LASAQTKGSQFHSLYSKIIFTQLERTRSEGLWHVIHLKVELKDNATKQNTPNKVQNGNQGYKKIIYAKYNDSEKFFWILRLIVLQTWLFTSALSMVSHRYYPSENKTHCMLTFGCIAPVYKWHTGIYLLMGANFVVNFHKTYVNTLKS